MNSPEFPADRSRGVLSTFSQSKSFHDSPQLFLGYDNTRKNVPNFVRAKILNRDVIVVSSYKHCRDVLQATTEGANSELIAERDSDSLSEETFTVSPAYHELMADFFPPPNILLLDAPEHRHARQKWDKCMDDVLPHIPSVVRQCFKNRAAKWKAGEAIDLYEDMKTLSWEILCAIFVGLTPNADREYSNFVSLQEQLLRGQFSLFPVSVRMPLWKSARSKGLDARKKLQKLLRDELASQTRRCPFAQGGQDIDQNERADNALLFTSSIAVKALSSLLTASLLNLFLFPHCQSSLAAQIRSEAPERRQDLLRSILLETERLSPPVIGVMRRVEHDIRLDDTSQQGSTEDMTIPAGWDAWLYFVGAARDETVYPQAHQLVLERFMSHSQPDPGFAFGGGGKQCLGKETVRAIVATIASEMLEGGWELSGSIDQKGIRGWLGWDADVSPEDLAKDIKQLPTQRPRKPVRVQVRQR